MLTCKICKKEFKYLKFHLKKKHNMNDEQYLKQFPGSLMRYDEVKDLSEKITCQLCKKKFKFLGFHLKKKHNMTQDEYIKQFPDAKLITEESRKIRSKAIKNCQSKIEQTCMERYGHKQVWASQHALQKRKETCLKKYGVENPSQSKFIKQKKIDTALKNYGVAYPFSHPDVKEKFKETCLEHYGVTHHMKDPEIAKKVASLRISKYMDTLGETLCEKYDCVPLFTQYQGKGQSYLFKCNTCNQEFEGYFRNGMIQGRCTKCYSLDENELIKFIQSIYSKDILPHDRTLIKPYELDIYLPELKLAIEYDGLYWHNNEHLEKDYHLKKTKMCQNKGVRLIHIFEDEWLYNKDLVKTKLKILMGCYDDLKIGARKCDIKEISSKEKNDFLNIYHIQGADKASVKLGLFYQNELIAAMTFCKPRTALGKPGYGDMELSRYATKYHIIGGASKLFNHFLKHNQGLTIYSYADMRWSQGNVYECLGFTMSHITKPNYWYIQNHVRFHRFKFRKDVLVKEGFDKNKTEKQIMTERKIPWIYDCGHMVFIYKKTQI